jgi:hypothetical protein
MNVAKVSIRIFTKLKRGKGKWISNTLADCCWSFVRGISTGESKSKEEE